MLIRPGNYWLEVQQDFIDTGLQDTRDRVFGLTCVVPKRTARAELADPHVTTCAGYDLKGQTTAILARKILVPLIRRPCQPPFVKRRVRAAAPGTNSLIPVTNRNTRMRAVFLFSWRNPWSTGLRGT